MPGNATLPIDPDSDSDSDPDFDSVDSVDSVESVESVDFDFDFDPQSIAVQATALAYLSRFLSFPGK